MHNLSASVFACILQWDGIHWSATWLLVFAFLSLASVVVVVKIWWWWWWCGVVWCGVCVCVCVCVCGLLGYPLDGGSNLILHSHVHFICFILSVCKCIVS